MIAMVKDTLIGCEVVVVRCDDDTDDMLAPSDEWLLDYLAPARLMGATLGRVFITPIPAETVA